MFSWYRDARLCIAYLLDVEHPSDRVALRKSVWFKRGWTLQELVASSVVVFLTNDWRVIGHKGMPAHLAIKAGDNLEPLLAEITRIPDAVLQDFSNSRGLSTGDKMLWVYGRQTLKEEDMVYALFGIFGVTPGANYGEGRHSAEERLMEAIHRRASRGAGDGPSGGRSKIMTIRAAAKQPDAKSTLARNVLHYVETALMNEKMSGWTTVEDLNAPSGISFKATYVENSTTAQLYLTCPSWHADDRADWVIIAPDSDYYPGRHEGHLILHNNKMPDVHWDTPLLSPYVFIGRLCVDPANVWTQHPRRLLDLLETMASLILRSPEDQANPVPRGHFSLYRVWEFHTPSNDWHIRGDWRKTCTTFFCRVYNSNLSASQQSAGAEEADNHTKFDYHTRRHEINYTIDCVTVCILGHELPPTPFTSYDTGCERRDFSRRLGLLVDKKDVNTYFLQPRGEGEWKLRREGGRTC